MLCTHGVAPYVLICRPCASKLDYLAKIVKEMTDKYFEAGELSREDWCIVAQAVEQLKD